ncbi:MAG: hypothetical protein AAB693_01510 [Patescibacteria group bacterium]
MSLNVKATQDFIPIKEIRDGIVILKDGGLRAIVMANSVNLSLRSDDEQRATLSQFQSFLNTLDFSVQISIQSRRLNIKPYLLLLEGRMKVQNEPLLKLQTREYIDFVRNFTDSVSIMTKNFFLIVPYTQTNFTPSLSIFGKFFSRKSSEEVNLAEKLNFEEKKSQLEQRVGVIQQGLSRCGVKSEQLGTKEVVELFYKTFNPGEVGETEMQVG